MTRSTITPIEQKTRDLFSMNVTNILKRKNITVTSLAKKVEVERPVLEISLKRVTTPSAELIEKVSRALDVEAGLIAPYMSEEDKQLTIYYFRKRLKSFCDTHALTIMKFSEETGVSKTQVGSYLQGKTLPSVKSLHKICGYLKVEPYNLDMRFVTQLVDKYVDSKILKKLNVALIEYVSLNGSSPLIVFSKAYFEYIDKSDDNVVTTLDGFNRFCEMIINKIMEEN